MTTPRDRDETGRARQSRPRDALGRPLPYGVPGVEPVPEEPLPPAEALREADRLTQQGRPFAAHEVLEARWKAAPEIERLLWKSLAQLSVAETHALRGNIIGARRLLDRGTSGLTAYGATDGPSYGLDLGRVAEAASRRVERAAEGGTTNPAGP